MGGLPLPSPGDLPDPEVEPASLVSPALEAKFFTTSTSWEAQLILSIHISCDPKLHPEIFAKVCKIDCTGILTTVLSVATRDER